MNQNTGNAEYPEKSWGSRTARNIRKKANRMSTKEREMARRIAMELIDAGRTNSSASISITHGSAMVDGSCNSCGRTTQTHGNYAVLEIRLRSCSIRVCADCAKILSSLLRGEVQNEQPKFRVTR